MGIPSARRALLAFGGLLVGALVAGETARVPQLVVVGEVVDLSCYLVAGARGAASRDAAKACLDKGSPCAILTDDGQIFLSLVDPKTEAADLASFLARRVRARGTAFRAGGVMGLLITKLEPLPEGPEAKPEPLVPGKEAPKPVKEEPREPIKPAPQEQEKEEAKPVKEPAKEVPSAEPPPAEPSDAPPFAKDDDEKHDEPGK